MNICHGKDAFSFILLLFLVCMQQTLHAADDFPPGAMQSIQDHGRDGDLSGQYGEDLLKSLVGDVSVSTVTAQTLCMLVHRHRQELVQLGDTRQDLVWEAIEVAIELLPSLKSIDANGGRLRVNRKTFAKLSALLGRCELLAGEELAQDLRRAKILVESRLKEDGEENLVIDLQD